MLSHTYLKPLIVLISCLFVSFQSVAREAIRDFHVDIEVSQDGSMTITETIQVVSAQQLIRHGIYRDIVILPDSDISVETTTINDRRVRSKREMASGGVRFKLGDPNRRLAPGEYTFVFKYKAEGFFKSIHGHAQIEWKLTGDYWKFPIEKFSMSLVLPESVPHEAAKILVYPTGGGLMEQPVVPDYADGNYTLKHSRRIQPGNGLVLSIDMPSERLTLSELGSFDGFSFRVLGLLSLDETMSAATYYRYGKLLSSIAIGTPLVLAFFLFMWFWVGRDPGQGKLQEISELPKELSPAVVRFLTRMKYDETTFLAAFLNLIVLNNIHVKRNGKEFDVTLGSTERRFLSDEGKTLSQGLGLSRHKALKIKPYSGSTLATCSANLASHLEEEFRGEYFAKNKTQWFLGVMMAVGSLLYSSLAWDASSGWAIFFASMICSGWMFILYFGRHKIFVRPRKQFLSLYRWMHIFWTTAFLLLFVPVFAFLFNLSSWLMVAYVVFMSVLCVVFAYLMPAPSRKGQQALSKIAGYKSYLEKLVDSLDPGSVHGQKDIEEYEKAIPYLVALGLDGDQMEFFLNGLAARVGLDADATENYNAVKSRLMNLIPNTESFTRMSTTLSAACYFVGMSSGTSYGAGYSYGYSGGSGGGYGGGGASGGGW